jgi:hypothetical protein
MAWGGLHDCESTSPLVCIPRLSKYRTASDLLAKRFANRTSSIAVASSGDKNSSRRWPYFGEGVGIGFSMHGVTYPLTATNTLPRRPVSRTTNQTAHGPIAKKIQDSEKGCDSMANVQFKCEQTDRARLDRLVCGTWVFAMLGDIERSDVAVLEPSWNGRDGASSREQCDVAGSRRPTPSCISGGVPALEDASRRSRLAHKSCLGHNHAPAPRAGR